MSVGLNLQAIREALAAQLEQQLGEEVNVTHYTPVNHVFPHISIQPHPDDYVAYFVTMGPDGNADVMLQIVVEVSSIDMENIANELDSFLSAGQGMSSSIVDAVMADRTLGGIVDDCVPLKAQVDNEIEGRAVIDVKVIISKQNAEVG